MQLVVREARPRAPGYGLSTNGTLCSTCRWARGSACELYDFEVLPGFTCDSWSADGAPPPERAPKPRRFELEQLREVGRKAMQKGWQFVVIQRPHPMRKAVMSMLVPPSGHAQTWAVGPYTCTYRHNGRLGVITLTGGGLPLPFSAVCPTLPKARVLAADLMRDLQAGVTPAVGLFVASGQGIERPTAGDKGGVDLWGSR